MDIGVTLDFGVAVHPHDGDTKSALMDLADQRLYELKNAGRESGAGPSSRHAAPLESHPARETPGPDIVSREPASRETTPPRKFPDAPPRINFTPRPSAPGSPSAAWRDALAVRVIFLGCLG